MDFTKVYLDSSPNLWTHHNALRLVLTMFYERPGGTMLAGQSLDYTTVSDVQFEQPGTSRQGDSLVTVNGRTKFVDQWTFRPLLLAGHAHRRP